MGGYPDFYPGYQPVESNAVRRKFEDAWGKGMPTRAGLTARQMVAAAAEGKLRALYILGNDMANGAVEGLQVRRALQNCDFVVLQEVFDSETGRNADVLLPGVTFAEKAGTFTNSERRVQMVRPAISPQGEARPDWEVITDLARRMRDEGAGGEYGEWDYKNTAQIMSEIAALTPIYAGVSQERIDKGGCLQWPVKNLGHAGTPMLGPESFAGGRGKFSKVRPHSDIGEVEAHR